MNPEKIREDVRGKTWRLVPFLETSQIRNLVEVCSTALLAPGIDASERIALHAERTVYREEIARRASA